MSIPSSNGKTVLVTGINGYIASVLGHLLLTKGYTVRGTTRRLASADPLLSGPYAPYKERVQIVEVADMTVSGAFDEAVKGVHGIFHTASPVDLSLDVYEKVVIPAERGNETVLESALKAGPQLSSVVVTSSVAAIVDPTDAPGSVINEEKYASVALDRANKDRADGVRTPAFILYGASKTAAERALWKFRDEHKPSFAITTINPAVVAGPPVLLAPTPSKLNETLKPIYDILSGTAKTVGPNFGSGSFVDVRDATSMHVWAFENAAKANGQRYIACQGFGPTQAIADILREHYKGTAIGKNIPVGNTGAGYVGYNKETGVVEDVQWPATNVKVSSKKAETDIGVEFITFKQSIIDTARVLEGLL